MWLSSTSNRLWVSLVLARNRVRAFSTSFFWLAAFSRIASYSVTGCLWVYATEIFHINLELNKIIVLIIKHLMLTGVRMYACGSGITGKWLGMCDGWELFVPACRRFNCFWALCCCGAGREVRLSRRAYASMPRTLWPLLIRATTTSPMTGCVRPDSSQ